MSKSIRTTITPKVTRADRPTPKYTAEQLRQPDKIIRDCLEKIRNSMQFHQGLSRHQSGYDVYFHLKNCKDQLMQELQSE